MKIKRQSNQSSLKTHANSIKNESNQLVKKQIDHKITMFTFERCFTFA